MQAVILAAGMGKRLKELTKGRPKCMVGVNGRMLVDRVMEMLDRKGMSRIVMVVGYEAALLEEHVRSLGLSTPVEFVENPIYDKSNNIYSLALADSYLEQEDTILLESDLIFEETLLDALLEDPRETLAVVDRYQDWMDGTCVLLDEADRITDFVPGRRLRQEDTDRYYKTVNIYKFSRHFSEDCYIPFLETYMKVVGLNEYYERALQAIVLLDENWIGALRLQGQQWYEIDNQQDLAQAEKMFC